MLTSLLGVVVMAAPVSPGATVSGKVAITLEGGSAKPDASEVVVYLADLDEKVSGAKAEVRQRNKQFVPRVLAVAKGTKVTFPNEDSLEHNVFSHSQSADFDLGRIPKGAGKGHDFDEVGVVEVFCNVHKEMVSYVVVAPSKVFAQTQADGAFTLKNVPPGHHTLMIWDRFAKPRFAKQEIDVPEAGLQLDLKVTEQANVEPAHKNKFGVAYPETYH